MRELGKSIIIALKSQGVCDCDESRKKSRESEKEHKRRELCAKWERAYNSIKERRGVRL